MADKERIMVYLSPALREAVAVRAVRERRTVSGLIEELLRRGMEADGQKVRDRAGRGKK